MFLKQAVTAQINKKQKLLTPIGIPITTSLIKPAINIEPYPK